MPSRAVVAVSRALVGRCRLGLVGVVLFVMVGEALVEDGTRNGWVAIGYDILAVTEQIQGGHWGIEPAPVPHLDIQPHSATPMLTDHVGRHAECNSIRP